jgi:hypothetical protein
MEDLIKQAFAHVDVIGPHVQHGHYDLVGPNGEIILPQVWDTMIEPDWSITMHMWPMPEPPKGGPPEGAIIVDAVPGHRPAIGRRPRDRPMMPPPPPQMGAAGGRRGPPPPPPEGWIGPVPQGMRPVRLNSDIVVVEEGNTSKSRKKTQSSGSVLGSLFGGGKSSKPSSKRRVYLLPSGSSPKANLRRSKK